MAKQAFFDKEEHLSMGFADSIWLQGIYVSYFQDDVHDLRKSGLRILEFIPHASYRKVE